MHSSVCDWPLLTVSTPHWWNYQHLPPYKQSQHGAFQQCRTTQILPSQGQWAVAGPGLGCFCLSKRIGKRKGWCWGRHLRTNFEALTASGGSRSKKQLKEWEITVSVSVRCISKPGTYQMFSLKALLLCHLHANSVLENAPSNFSLKNLGCY